MVNKVENIKELSVSNARSVEEIASASDHLSNMTANLNNILETYKS
jgi:methyl-accepting chemotaxis protein